MFENLIGVMAQMHEKNPGILSLGLFGSVETESTWARSDIDMLLITNETNPRLEVIYDRTDGQLIHYQVLSLNAWNEILASQDNPIFGPLAVTRILFDKTGDLDRGISLARDFPERMRLMWACRELTAAVAHLHYAEKYLHLGLRRDAITQLRIALGSLATMELYQQGIYASRDVWSQPEVATTQAAEFMARCEAGEIEPVSQAWNFVRPQFATCLAPLLIHIAENAPMTFFNLLQAAELRRMTISERLVQEMLNIELIREERTVHSVLGIPEVKYYPWG